jgi:hypothetical protein
MADKWGPVDNVSVDRSTVNVDRARMGRVKAGSRPG